MTSIRRGARRLVEILALLALAACGGGTDTAGTPRGGPTVTLSASPASVTSGARATLSWSSTEATSCTASGGWSGTRAVSGTERTPALTADATYVLDCSGPGGNASASVAVDVGAAPAPTVTLSASPSNVASGEATTLSWSSTDATGCTASGAWSGARAASGSQSSGALTAASTFTLTCTGPGGSASTSTTVTVASPQHPTVTLSASPSTVTSGAATVLNWSSRNATSCSASGDWSGSKALSGSQSSGALTRDSSFTLTCSGAGGSAGVTAAVTVQPATPAPTVTLTASPTSVASGGTTTLTWSTTDATSCTASGAWTGARATQGSATSGAITAASTFTLRCTGAGGSTSASTTVTVAPPPTVTLTASPTGVTSGGSSTLTWTSSNATSCTASGAWSGSKATSGSASTGALAASATYTLSCNGVGGSASASATVTVSATPAPTVSLTASPTSVASGGSSTLTWSSSNATGCTASGAWSGSKGTSGSASTGALTSAATYTLSCSGAGGSASASATVTIASSGTLGFSRVVVDGGGGVPSNPWMKNVADLNDDGLPDLIVSGASGPVVWYQAPGWTQRTISASADSESGSAVGDIDGDGLIDVVIGKTWYQNVGKGSSWTARPLPAGSAGTHDIVVADINNDGKLDIVMRGETASVVTVYLQQSPTSWTVFDVDPGIGLNGLDVADVNGDGFADIVVGGKWMQNPGANFSTAAWTARTFTTGWDDYAAVKVIDIDRDGRPDIVLSVSENVGKLSWFKAPSDPTTGPWVENVVATGLDHVHGVSVFDFDKDGWLDIATSEYAGPGRLMVYRGNGGSSWTGVELGRDSLHNVVAADIDADGDLDLFGVNAWGNPPAILYRNTYSAASRVLVFSKTLGFRHDSIPDGIAALQALGTANGFTVDATEDSAVFTSPNLARYKAVVFLNPSGDVLDTAQRAALRLYIENGGGFVGVHNSNAYTLEDWVWYTKMHGARYVSEITTQPMTLRIVDATHGSTQGLPDPWNITFEAYNWDVNPKTGGGKVLINLDETSVSGGAMGADHPFSWYKPYAGGRFWYTVGGANSADYADTDFMKHLLGGIRYAGAF